MPISPVRGFPTLLPAGTMMMTAALMSLLSANVDDIEFTTAKRDAATSGKTVLVMFHAP